MFTEGAAMCQSVLGGFWVSFGIVLSAIEGSNFFINLDELMSLTKT